MSFYDDASLVLIPSGYKAGKVYSQKPLSTDGELTFTRASHATRVNVNGYVEKARTNNLLQSNTFSTTWVNSNTTETGGQADKDGGTDAWLLDKSAAAGHIRQLGLSVGTVGVVSLYAKAGTLNWMRLGTQSGNIEAYFDLSTGAVGNEGALVIASAIESAGNGWYRCSFAYSGTATGVYLYPADGNGDTSGTSGNIYIQDAQLEQGLVATDYIETTTAAVTVGMYNDVPRLDYSGGASCPALLLEPQRTNLFTQSEYYGSGGWVIDSGTLTTNYAVSPEGVQNASKINFSAGGEIVRTTTFTAGQAYTFSFYAKVESGTFDFTYGNIDYSLISGTATTEWQRFEVTQTAPVVTRYPKIDATDTGDLLIWGCQIEQGSYATSYIPTYGSSVTRSADDCETGSIASLIGQSEGTFFIDIENALETDKPYIALSAGGSTANRVLIYKSGAAFYAQVKVGGVVQYQSGSFSYTGGARAKFAVAYKANDFKFYANGTEVHTSTSGSTFGAGVLTELDLAYSNKLGCDIYKALVFETALSAADLATLTT